MPNDSLLLNQQKIQAAVKSADIEIELLEEIDSTNQYLKLLPIKPTISVCLAEKQTHGKGRLNRHWHSPFGKNIYLSMRYPFKNGTNLSGLSIAIGLSLCTIIESLYALEQPLLIKWPNDIIYDHQKLAGILIELNSPSRDFCYAIIGIGINVNMDDDSSHINQPWTSLKKITGKNTDRNSVCSALIDQLIKNITLFEKTGLAAFIEQWQTRDSLLHQPVKLQSGDKIFTGKGCGVTHQGHLIIETTNGEILQLSSGDTTVIK